LSPLMHALGKEYVYPGVELQEHRAQAFYEAHKWKEARSEFEKLLTMLNTVSTGTVTPRGAGRACYRLVNPVERHTCQR